MKWCNWLVALMGILAATLQAELWPNLELMAQDYVLENRQLVIPGYSDAFNPSIISWKGRFLMSFRTRVPSTGSTRLIGFVWLNKELELTSDVQILDFQPAYLQASSAAQDPRLIEIGGELYMVYSNLVDTSLGALRRVVVAKLIVNGDEIELTGDWPLTDYEGLNPGRHEKNWVPFEYQGELLLSHNIQPHTIFQPSLTSGSCRIAAVTSNDLVWDWGELRGGTPALLCEGRYLSFFHSSKEMKTVHSDGKKISHYFMGAYLFSFEPPFEVTHFSSSPIVTRGLYTGPTYTTWKPLRAVFPAGYLIDENHLFLFYGKQDHELWVLKLDKKSFLESLDEV